MKEHETIDYARRRLVELWVQLSDDHPLVQDLEGELLYKDVKGSVEAALQVLVEGETFGAEWNKLVLLRALDTFLAGQEGTASTGGEVQLGTPVRLQDEQLYFLYRRPPSLRQPRVEGQMGHLRRWTRHHQVVPEKLRGYEIVFVRPSRQLSRELARLRQDRQPLKVAIGRFEDGVSPDWMARHRPHFRAETLTAPETRWKALSGLLERARTAGAHVLVLPELTVSPDLRLRIQGWLAEHADMHSLLLVLPGTFHEADPAGQAGEVVNRTELLDAYGQPVLTHTKLLRFGKWESGAEHIRLGKRIQLLTLPLGLLATPICLDFCEAAPPLPELWNDLGPALLLVPAMGDSPNRSAHAAAARRLLITRGSVTVLANQPMSPGASAPGFICDSLERDPTKPDKASRSDFEVVAVDLPPGET